MIEFIMNYANIYIIVLSFGLTSSESVGFSSPLQSVPFKIGFILEESVLESVELESGLELLRSHLNVEFDFVLKSFQYRDSFTTLQQACRALREGASFLVAQTSCASTHAIQTMTHSLQLPTLFMPKFSSCSKIPGSSSTSFPMRVNNSLLYNRLGSILTQNDWNNYLLMYDDYFDESYVTELDRVLTESAMDTKRENLVGGKIKLYDPETTQDMQAALINLNTDKKYNNFIVLASQQNTLRLLKQSENLGLFGLNYKWILANIDLDVTQFRDISPQFNALMIIRKLPFSAFQSKSGFVDPKWDGKNEIGVSQNLTYILNAAELAIAALNSTFHTQKTDFDQVKALNCFGNTKFKDGPNIIDQIKATKILEDDSRDYFGVTNDFLGITFFKNSLYPEDETLENPVSEEDRFEVYPHLEMLRYDLREDESPAGWKRVDAYNALSFQPTWHLPKHIHQVFRVGKTSLDGSTLKIVTVVEEPFIIVVKRPGGQFVYEGYCMDVLKAIQHQVAQEFNENFEFDIQEANGYGVLDEETGEWNGMVAEILSGKADMAVAGMIRNFDREKVIDFTAAYMDYGVGILIRKPQPEINIYGFMEPLSKRLWCIIAVCSFGSSLLLYVLAKVSPYERLYSPGVYTFPNSVWWIMGALMLQGGDYNPKSLSNRCLCNVVWMFSVLLVSIYTANLAAFLTVTRLTTPIEELRDLAGQSEIQYGTIAKTSLSSFFQQQAAKGDILYSQLWDHMNKTVPSSMVRDIDEGYNRVLKQNYAFMWDYPVLQYQKKKHCDYMTVGKAFNRKKYAFAVPKGSGYLNTITLSILSLQESGVLEQIREKWFEGESKCVVGGNDGGSALTYNNIGGIFWILVFGILAAIVVNILESIWHKFIEKRSRCDFPRVMQSVRQHFKENLNDSTASSL